MTVTQIAARLARLQGLWKGSTRVVVVPKQITLLASELAWMITKTKFPKRWNFNLVGGPPILHLPLPDDWWKLLDDAFDALGPLRWNFDAEKLTEIITSLISGAFAASKIINVVTKPVGPRIWKKFYWEVLLLISVGLLAGAHKYHLRQTERGPRENRISRSRPRTKGVVWPVVPPAPFD